MVTLCQDILCLFFFNFLYLFLLFEYLSKCSDQWFLNEEGQGIPIESVENLEDVKNDIRQKLNYYRSIFGHIYSMFYLPSDRLNPNITESPVIYHFDVAAMYPNIILTNRLQPTSIVDEHRCNLCPYANQSEY